MEVKVMKNILGVNEKIAAEQSFEEAKKRNEELTKAKIAEMESRRRRREEILEEISATVKERTSLEEKIYDSVADEAAKFAVLNHLEFVIVKTDYEFPDNFLPVGGREMTFELKEKKKIGTPVFSGGDTKDLTADVLKELERRISSN